MLAQLVLATPRPLIGIYPTVGHSPGAYDEYQSWLSAAGADSRVLPTTFTGAKLEPLFQSLNGFLIPGGGNDIGRHNNIAFITIQLLTIGNRRCLAFGFNPCQHCLDNPARLVGAGLRGFFSFLQIGYGHWQLILHRSMSATRVQSAGT